MKHERVSSAAARRVLYRAGGLVVLLATWQLLGHSGVAGKTLPSLTQVLQVYAIAARRALLLRAAAATTSAAGLGLLIGATLGFATALLAHLLVGLGPGLNRLAVVVNAVPAIVLGPILIVTAGRAQTPMLLAAIPVYFLLYVATGSGLRSADHTLGQLFTVANAGRWKRLVYLEAVYAVPSLLSGLKIGITTAMIGAVVGEWFGAPTGLGIVILNSMQNFQIPLMWATVLVVASISLAAYAALGATERAVLRWFQ